MAARGSGARGPRLQARLALGLTAVGVVLTALHIHADSEPGGLPLLVTLVGIAWFVLARRRRG